MAKRVQKRPLPPLAYFKVARRLDAKWARIGAVSLRVAAIVEPAPMIGGSLTKAPARFMENLEADSPNKRFFRYMQKICD